jgi:hypothetical protein
MKNIFPLKETDFPISLDKRLQGADVRDIAVFGFLLWVPAAGKKQAAKKTGHTAQQASLVGHGL